MPPSEKDERAAPRPARPPRPRPRPDSGYRAYVLRCWREETGWRFGLEDPHSGVQRGFASLVALVAALRADLAEGAPAIGKRRPQAQRGRGSAR